MTSNDRDNQIKLEPRGTILNQIYIHQCFVYLGCPQFFPYICSTKFFFNFYIIYYKKKNLSVNQYRCLLHWMQSIGTVGDWHYFKLAV